MKRNFQKTKFNITQSVFLSRGLSTLLKTTPTLHFLTKNDLARKLNLTQPYELSRGFLNFISNFFLPLLTKNNLKLDKKNTLNFWVVNPLFKKFIFLNYMASRLDDYTIFTLFFSFIKIIVCDEKHLS